MEDSAASPPTQVLLDNEAYTDLIRRLSVLLPDDVPDRDSILARAVDGLLERVPTPDGPNAGGVVTLNGPNTGASRKGTNLFLNWRKLIETTPDVSMATVGAVTGPHLLIPFAALYVWNILWKATDEKLSEVEASVILALWQNRDSRNRIGEDLGFSATERLRGQSALSPIPRATYNRAVNKLAQMDCVVLEDGDIWLREDVRLT